MLMCPNNYFEGCNKKRNNQKGERGKRKDRWKDGRNSSTQCEINEKVLGKKKSELVVQVSCGPRAKKRGMQGQREEKMKQHMERSEWGPNLLRSCFWISWAPVVPAASWLAATVQDGGLKDRGGMLLFWWFTLECEPVRIHLNSDHSLLMYLKVWMLLFRFLFGFSHEYKT